MTESDRMNEGELKRFATASTGTTTAESHRSNAGELKKSVTGLM